MAGGMFHRLVALTINHELVRIRSNRLPYPSGGSPLWDAIMLSYDEELDKHSGERNALIVISDGIDNRISEQALPSVLRASRLIQAAGEMDVRIYPIFLLSGERFGRNWSGKAYKQLNSLAKKTGGRVFSARSVADIEPVLPLLAQEMRSVYGIAYYPSNQVFNGDWRKVKIRVNQTGTQVRARPGYLRNSKGCLRHVGNSMQLVRLCANNAFTQVISGCPGRLSHAAGAGISTNQRESFHHICRSHSCAADGQFDAGSPDGIRRQLRSCTDAIPWPVRTTCQCHCGDHQD